MKPYSHQQAIIDADPKKTGLFLSTGAGKTKVALLLARGTVLIVAPKTQVEDGNWYREAMQTHLTKIKGELTVISKETFRRDHEKLPHFDTVIIDESHCVCGLTPNTRQRARQTIPLASQLFEAAQAYLARTKPERLYLCTATPTRNPMAVLAAAWLLEIDLV